MIYIYNLLFTTDVHPTCWKQMYAATNLACGGGGGEGMPCTLLFSGKAGPWKAQFCSEGALRLSEQGAVHSPTPQAGGLWSLPALGSHPS